MAPENHDEVQTNANLPEVFPQIRNKPVKFDTREGGFPLFETTLSKSQTARPTPRMTTHMSLFSRDGIALLSVRNDRYTLRSPPPPLPSHCPSWLL